MIDLIPLRPETVELVSSVQQVLSEWVSYYFPIDTAALEHTLFAQPEVHPATFEISSEASLIAVENGEALGWIQAGYLSHIPTIPEGECDGLIRCMMVNEGQKEAGEVLLRRSLEVLLQRTVRAWRAFEHNCGYTFATGIGKAPLRMKAVIDLLTKFGFKPEEINLVYASESLHPASKDKELGSINFQFASRGWSEEGASVQWDQLILKEGSEQVGYATITPVGRLTDNPAEDTLFIKGIAVEPRHRRQGIGHAIMSWLWQHYHPQGINRLILNTADDNIRAQKFYEAIGFEMTDRISSFISKSLSNIRPCSN